MWNSEKKVDSKNNKFLKLFSEKENINQYWFSESTIEFIVNQITSNTNETSKIAFVSTPSIFFSCDSNLQNKSFLFDLDERLIKKHKNALKFDFNDFTELINTQSNLIVDQFDFIIVDPPYINEPSWTKFAEFVKVISRKNEVGKISAKILTCSIAENKEILNKLLDLEIKKYQPSIPHLVYQYNFYANYEDSKLDEINPEIIID